MPSARRFCEQLEYNLLFKWFLDRNVDDPAFDASTFSKNQERLLQHDVARHRADGAHRARTGSRIARTHRQAALP